MRVWATRLTYRTNSIRIYRPGPPVRLIGGIEEIRRRTRKKQSQRLHAFKNRKHEPPYLVRAFRLCHTPDRGKLHARGFRPGHQASPTGSGAMSKVILLLVLSLMIALPPCPYAKV